MKSYDDVVSFHQKFDVNPSEDRPHFPPPDVIDYRVRFLQEELNEFQTSYEQNDMPGMVDALIDLLYVLNGTAYLMGISPLCWRECWDEVQRANMTKVRATSAADPRSKRKHSLDVVKPEGWVGPDHLPILRRHGYDE